MSSIVALNTLLWDSVPAVVLGVTVENVGIDVEVLEVDQLRERKKRGLESASCDE